VFGTVTAQLHALRDWLKAQGVRSVAMECRRRFNFEPPCRLNIEPGVEADVEMVGCG
jgi:hypothetical protein